jgi:hypothetical protein
MKSLFVYFFLFIICSAVQAESLIDKIVINKNEKVISFTPWYIAGKKLVAINKETEPIIIPDGQGKPRIQILSIYNDVQNKPIELYQEQFIGESFVCLFPDNRKEGRLYFVSLGRRYFTIRSYYYFNNKIKQVLFATSDCFPDIYITQDNYSAVKVRKYLYLENDTREIISVYKWDENKNEFTKAMEEGRGGKG